MKNTLIFTLLLTTFCPLKAQNITVSSGKVQRFDNFASKFVDARNVDVLLPEGYTPTKKYAVLYMHDGQMLFDSTKTWNKQEWKVDETLEKLTKTGKIKDCIVVGIWNSGKNRHLDYFPQKPFESLSAQQQDSLYNSAKRQNQQSVFAGKVQSDAYLKFLVTELKPFIDKTFATRPDRKNTFVAGSSMGGLISMYAICEYPSVFGGAACISTHWVGTFSLENNPIPEAFRAYLRQHLPKPKTHKIYFDYGTETLDAMYPPLQKQVDEIMKNKGFSEKNWQTKAFIGENHSEQAWSKRLDVPLLFLLEK